MVTAISQPISGNEHNKRPTGSSREPKSVIPDSSVSKTAARAIASIPESSNNNQPDFGIFSHVADAPEASFYQDLVDVLKGREKHSLSALYFVANEKNCLERMNASAKKGIKESLGSTPALVKTILSAPTSQVLIPVYLTTAKLQGFDTKLRLIEEEASKSPLKELASQLIDRDDFATNQYVNGILTSFARYGCADPNSKKAAIVIDMAKKSNLISKSEAES